MKPMDPHAERRLPELIRAAAALIDRAGLQLGDERVSAHPDARVVRYYQSLGLVDRPLRYEGRAAIYGWPHLAQVVGVKLLQSQGYSLARVQEAFAGLPFAQLEAAVLQAVGQGAVGHGAVGRGLASQSAPSPAEQRSLTLAPPPSLAPRALVSVELAPGVHLSVDPALVSDPQALIARLSHALHLHPPSPRTP